MLKLCQECIDKWKLDEIDQIVDEVEEKIEQRINNEKISFNSDFLKIFLHVMKRAIIAMREILHLLAAGYPDGALCIARNIYENMIIIKFLEKKSDDVNFNKIIEKYVDDMCVVQHSNMRQFCKRIASEEAKLHDEELNKIKKKYNIDKGKNITDYWWADKKSFSDLVKEVFDFKDKERSFEYAFLILLYKKACTTVHATCTGNIATIGRHRKLDLIESGRTKFEFHVPLYLSIRAFQIIMQTLFEQLDVDYKNIDEKIVKLLDKYFENFFSEDSEGAK